MYKKSSLKNRALYPHFIKEHVRWSDTDMVGHVNNLSFSTYFETGRTEFLQTLIAKDAERRILMVLARMSVDYLDEIHWPSDVDVGTGILEIGQASCRMGQALFIGERCVSVSESVLVMIDENTRKPLQIPEWVRSFFSNFNIVK
jgi:acyl-CoA thioester hydrolase